MNNLKCLSNYFLASMQHWWHECNLNLLFLQRADVLCTLPRWRAGAHPSQPVQERGPPTQHFRCHGDHGFWRLHRRRHRDLLHRYTSASSSTPVDGNFCSCHIMMSSWKYTLFFFYPPPKKLNVILIMTQVLKMLSFSLENVHKIMQLSFLLHYDFNLEKMWLFT